MRGFIIGLIVTSTISILLCLIKDDDGYLYLPIKLVYVFIRSIGSDKGVLGVIGSLVFLEHS